MKRVVLDFILFSTEKLLHEFRVSDRLLDRK